MRRTSGPQGRRSRYSIVTVTAIMAAMPSVGVAEYRLAVGDVIETTVSGAPELTKRSQIGQDGQVLLPLGESVMANGLPLSQLKDKARQLIPTKQFHRQSNEGNEYPVIIAATDVDVSIAEYRPVYLNGDVAKPGEQPFRPGLTVRQGVALAGGYDILRFRMNNPFLEQSDLKGQYNSLWMQFAQQELRVASLKAQLEGKAEIGNQDVTGGPLPASLDTQIRALERDRMKTTDADFAKEKVYLKEAAGKEGSRISILSEQQQKEAAGVQEDNDEFQRLQGFFQRGALPFTRLVDARRSLLLSATRQLQTQALLAQVDRERQEFNHRAEKIEDQRRLALIDELQTANLKLADIRARLQAVGEKLVYVGMVRSQLVRGKDSSAPDLTIFRKNENGTSETLKAEPDDELHPGDVVEVSLAMEMVPGLPAH